jgi:hypothetical protein
MKPWFAAVLLVLLPCLTLGQVINDQEKADGFAPFFNGKDLTGWKILQSKEDKNWIAEDKLIVCTGKGGGWLGTEKEYADFELRLEYKLPPAGNSGIYLRAPDEGQISRVGMEIQILDEDHPQYQGKIQDYQRTGALYHVVAPSQKAIKPAGEWNEMTIRLQGRKLDVFVNGKPVVKTDLDECLKDQAIAKEHPGLTRTKGRIGLQNHSSRVEYRNLRIKELK